MKNDVLCCLPESMRSVHSSRLCRLMQSSVPRGQESMKTAVEEEKVTGQELLRVMEIGVSAEESAVRL